MPLLQIVRCGDVTVPEHYANIGISASIRASGNRDGADNANRLARQASVR
ncbi:MAG: hypothetical protein HC930_12090 [Hydrococcus sp. SU_1_0]|nr:hypothetical protein [Hydrococcus sp. SU_1_0]